MRNLKISTRVDYPARFKTVLKQCPVSIKFCQVTTFLSLRKSWVKDSCQYHFWYSNYGKVLNTRHYDQKRKSEKPYLDFKNSGLGWVKYAKIFMGKPHQLLQKSKNIQGSKFCPSPILHRKLRCTPSFTANRKLRPYPHFKCYCPRT